MAITQRQLAQRLTRLFSFMPETFNSKTNFSALMGSIATSDCDLENLFIEVRKQLFIDTAEGGYLDKLGSNVGIVRPSLLGMVDEDFREFIKLQTYYPKQIRQLLFRLMELFYGRDTIKANIRSVATGPFIVFDGATLKILVDGNTEYEVTFSSSAFNDPNSVLPQEIAAQINAQVSEGVFASTYFNAIDKLEYVELFTNTFGPVGAIEVLGGSANRFLKFPNTLSIGSVTSQYRLVKSSTAMTLYWAGGVNPVFSQVRIGDYVILTGTPILAANVGSFVVESAADTGVPASILAATNAIFQSANVIRYSMPLTTDIAIGNEVTVSGFHNATNNGTYVVLDVAVNYIELQTARVNNADDETHAADIDLLPNASYVTFSNSNGTSQSVFSIVSIDDVLFFRSKKNKIESSLRPASVWEINANEIIITLPATPVIVRRQLAGSSHLQGTSALVTGAYSGSIELSDVEYFPLTLGSFYLQKLNGMILTDTKYSYTALNGTTLQGISPAIEIVGEKLVLGVGPLSVTNTSNIIEITTTDPHLLSSGELVDIKNFDGFGGLLASEINGIRSVISIVNDIIFTVTADDVATSTVTNTPAVNKGEIFTARNSKVIITNIQQNTGYIGSYIYDPLNALYTISEVQTTITQDILLGEFGTALSVSDSDVFPETSDDVVINYGREDEEGPIKYIAKPGTGNIFIDPSYRFEKSHSSGAAINLITYKYATVADTLGTHYPVYVVDTVGPRETLKDLLLEAKAAGVTVVFVVVLPENVYNSFSLYE